MIDRNSYPDGASLDEQRRAFALSRSHGPLEAARFEQYLAGPTGDAQSSDPVTSGEADTYPSDLPHNPFVTGSSEAEAWLGGYTAGIRWERERTKDYDDINSYDRGFDRGFAAGQRKNPLYGYKLGWNTALDEVLAKVSFAVRKTEVQTLSGVLTVSEILREMKK